MRRSRSATGCAACATAADQWRLALTSAADAALDTVGRSQYPDGSDPDEPFIEIVWWENQELLHRGAEIALLRDLYRALVPVPCLAEQTFGSVWEAFTHFGGQIVIKTER